MKVNYRGTILSVEKMKDSTHVIVDKRAFHVGEFSDKELSNDLYLWLSDHKTTEEIEAKVY